jgi:hypothetical protein
MCFWNGWSINYTSQKLHIENVFECAFNRIIFVLFVKQNYGYFFLKLCVGLITGMVGLVLFFRESHHGALYFTSNGDTSFITSILIMLGGSLSQKIADLESRRSPFIPTKQKVLFLMQSSQKSFYRN